MNQPLSWRVIVGYSLGDVANNFAFAMGALFLLSYYTDVAGVGAAAAGTMLLLVRIFDAFADVVAGRIVDSVNTRWGKFRPFLLFGSAPLMLFSVLVFCVPAEWSHSNKVIYAYLTYMGLGFCYSMVNIPYGSLATADRAAYYSFQPDRNGVGLPLLDHYPGHCRYGAVFHLF